MNYYFLPNWYSIVAISSAQIDAAFPPRLTTRKILFKFHLSNNCKYSSKFPPIFFVHQSYEYSTLKSAFTVWITPVRDKKMVNVFAAISGGKLLIAIAPRLPMPMKGIRLVSFIVLACRHYFTKLFCDNLVKWWLMLRSIPLRESRLIFSHFCVIERDNIFQWST